MRRPVPARAPLVTAPPHLCAVCGQPLAQFGVGPPLAALQQWFCGIHWLFQPSTQAMFSARCLEAIGE